ncbi:MAG: Nif3-like dinuclear metal center hexameric protein [Deltaproteobacteria bacterium]|nr:Nif3-like dinuclear metal center hexameric protein [Deltaproteobacteria bacterium]
MTSRHLALPRREFTALLQRWMQPERYTDVAENGLQIEGAPLVERVVTGVSANRALIEAAIERSANTIVVHHGLVWGGGMRRLDGWLKGRVRLLLQHDINLFAYHLPLDAHPDLGNNVGLAAALGMGPTVPFGRYKGQLIGRSGSLAAPVTLAGLVARGRLAFADDAPVHAFGPEDRVLSTIGLCTGGAPELIHEAIDAGLDAYVTGEATEYVKAVAEESGVAFLAFGHHATERFGPRALAEALCSRGLDASFVEIKNPV